MASDGTWASTLSVDLIASRHASRGPETAFISARPAGCSAQPIIRLPPLQASFWSQAAVTVCTHSSFTLMNTWRQQRATHAPHPGPFSCIGNRSRGAAATHSGNDPFPSPSTPGRAMRTRPTPPYSHCGTPRKMHGEHGEPCAVFLPRRPTDHGLFACWALCGRPITSAVLYRFPSAGRPNGPQLRPRVLSPSQVRAPTARTAFFSACKAPTHALEAGPPAVSLQTRAKRPFSQRPLPATASTSRTSDKEKPARPEMGHFQISLCACVLCERRLRWLTVHALPLAVVASVARAGPVRIRWTRNDIHGPERMASFGASGLLLTPAARWPAPLGVARTIKRALTALLCDECLSRGLSRGARQRTARSSANSEDSPKESPLLPSVTAAPAACWRFTHGFKVPLPDLFVSSKQLVIRFFHLGNSYHGVPLQPGHFLF
ncbi:hypothetical protein MRX96_007533 [Rhipicephalus microplus]